MFFKGVRSVKYIPILDVRPKILDHKNAVLENFNRFINSMISVLIASYSRHLFV